MKKIHCPSWLLFFCLVTLFALPALAQKEYSIAALQGEKNVSPHDGETVRISGIVTARTRTGFFVQTPDDKIDGSPLTSEGIFVFTKNAPPEGAAAGNLVSVSGRLVEFRPRNEPASLTITEISHFIGKDSFSVETKNNPLPKPILLTFADFRSNTIDQLEKYEGMRVAVAEMTAVSPTGGRIDHQKETVTSDGVFYGVLKGTPRPFREPGMDILDYLASDERDKWKKELPRLPIFDGNPEAIRVDTIEQISSKGFSLDSDADKLGIRGRINLLGQPLNVTAKSEIKDVIGVLHYEFGKYAILTDAGSKPTVSNTITPKPLPPPTERQFSIAATNIETFVDDADDPGIKEDVATPEAFQKRLGKISLAVRDYLQFPDILAVIEAENLNVLKKLAEKINTDSIAAGKPNPKYEAYLFDGSDPRGIDSGFLVKTSRVTVASAKQFGKDERYKNPNTKNDDILNDRPPIMIEAKIIDAKTGQPFAVTVVANHLKSLRGVDDEKDGPNVRMKKKLQAEFLAKWVNERMKTKPDERILLVGDFNAYQFSDGLVDVIGTLKGSPAPKDAVMLASEDLVNPDLSSLVDFINADQQYSFLFDGSAQVLDHFLANAAMKKHLAGFGYLRCNADFPQIYRADGNRVERFSDHDVAVGYFNFE